MQTYYFIFTSTVHLEMFFVNDIKIIFLSCLLDLDPQIKVTFSQSTPTPVLECPFDHITYVCVCVCYISKF